MLRNGPFLRLWLAQIISNLGDWAYVLAVEISFTSSLDANALVRATAIFLGVEGLTSAVVGLTIGGPIVDRFPRRVVMIVADLARCAAVATLVFVPDPSLLHVVGVAATLGAFRSLFHPAMMASVPELVEGESIVVANGLLTSTFHLAIMVGPAIGAALVVAVGPAGAFALNAGSFAVSAALLLGLRIPSEPSAPRERFSPLADLREGAGYILRSRLARGIAQINSAQYKMSGYAHSGRQTCLQRHPHGSAAVSSRQLCYLALLYHRMPGTSSKATVHSSVVIPRQ